MSDKQNFQLKGGAMSKKSCLISLKNFCLSFSVLMITAVFVLGSGVLPVQAVTVADAQKGVDALVDINSATQKELESIKGIGPATAKKIIAARPYKSVNDLSRAGLSAKAIEAVKPFVTVGKGQAAAAKTSVAEKKAAVATDMTKAGKDVKAMAAKSTSAAKLAPGTKININTAEQSALEKLPGIGPVKAKAIIAGRPYKSVEDVTKVSGIKGKTYDAIKEYIVVK